MTDVVLAAASAALPASVAASSVFVMPASASESKKQNHGRSTEDAVKVKRERKEEENVFNIGRRLMERFSQDAGTAGVATAHFANVLSGGGGSDRVSDTEKERKVASS